MKVKISEYTPYLLVGLLIVVIARHFYNPLQLVDMWEVVQEGEEMSMPIRMNFFQQICNHNITQTD